MKQNMVYRFTENGVGLFDYNQTVEAIHDWNEWCPAWSRTAAARVAEAERAEAARNIRTAAELRLLASSEYHFAKFLFVHDLDQMQEAHRHAVECYRAAVANLP
jgi:hypothetical protein